MMEDNRKVVALQFTARDKSFRSTSEGIGMNALAAVMNVRVAPPYK